MYPFFLYFGYTSATPATLAICGYTPASLPICGYTPAMLLQLSLRIYFDYYPGIFLTINRLYSATIVNTGYTPAICGYIPAIYFYTGCIPALYSGYTLAIFQLYISIPVAPIVFRLSVYTCCLRLRREATPPARHRGWSFRRQFFSGRRSASSEEPGPINKPVPDSGKIRLLRFPRPPRKPIIGRGIEFRPRDEIPAITPHFLPVGNLCLVSSPTCHRHCLPPSGVSHGYRRLTTRPIPTIYTIPIIPTIYTILTFHTIPIILTIPTMQPSNKTTIQPIPYYPHNPQYTHNPHYPYNPLYAVIQPIPTIQPIPISHTISTTHPIPTIHPIHTIHKILIQIYSYILFFIKFSTPRYKMFQQRSKDCLDTNIFSGLESVF